MIKRFLLFCLILIVPILSTSQTTSDSILISSEQLRTTNIIFAEHAKLFDENVLLKSQVINLEKLDSIWLHTDSIRRIEINNYEDTLKQNEKKIRRLKRRSKIFGVLSSGLVIAVVCLAL